MRILALTLRTKRLVKHGPKIESHMLNTILFELNVVHCIANIQCL